MFMQIANLVNYGCVVYDILLYEFILLPLELVLSFTHIHRR